MKTKTPIVQKCLLFFACILLAGTSYGQTYSAKVLITNQKINSPTQIQFDVYILSTATDASGACAPLQLANMQFGLGFIQAAFPSPSTVTVQYVNSPSNTSEFSNANQIPGATSTVTWSTTGTNPYTSTTTAATGLSGQNVVTIASGSALAEMFVGEAVTGSVAAGTYITNISGNTVTLSGNLTANNPSLTFPANSQSSITGSGGIGSFTVNVASAAQFYTGMVVAGTNIPVGSTITAISGNTLTLSLALAAVPSGTLTGTYTERYLDVSGSAAVGFGSGSIISCTNNGCSAPGTRWGTFIVNSTGGFNPGIAPLDVFCTSSGTGGRIQTALTVFTPTGGSVSLTKGAAFTASTGPLSFGSFNAPGTCATNNVLNSGCSVTASASVTNSVCANGTGSALITLGGTINGVAVPANYSGQYILDGGAPVQINSNPFTISGLAASGGAGTSHTVQLVNANSLCLNQPSTTFSVTAPGGVLTMGACSSTNALCFGGTGSVSAGTLTNNSNPVTYSWKNSSNVSVGGNNATVSNLPPDTYTLTVTDQCPTPVTCQVTITAPSAISASGSAGTILCHDGSTTVTVTASGGTGTLSGTGTFTVPAGPYSFTVTDGNGCTAVVSGTIANPPAISASASAGTILCHDGTTTVTVTASGGTGTLSGTGTFTVPAGPYSFTVTDDNGCTAVVSGTIANPPAISASASAGTILCHDGTTTVTVTASGGTGTLSGTGTFTVGAGPYSFTVTDANGCTAVVSGTIANPPAISASASAGTILCHDGSTTVTVTASGGTGTLSGTGTFTVNAGPYSYTVTDANGCTAVVSGTIANPPAISASASAGTILCHDGTTTVTVTASGGTGTLNGTGTFTVPAGPYSFTVTDANGCTAVVSGTIANPPAISASASAGTILCHDGTTTVTVTASGGTGTLSGTGTFTVNAGPYSYTVTDGNGCTAVVSGTIANPPAISASASAGTILCHDGTTTVTVTASGGTGTLSGTGTFTVNAGPYSFTVTDVNGCTAVVSGTIANPPAISASASAGTILCNNGTTTVTVTASGGTGTLNGTGTFTVHAGPYSYTVTDANGCTAVVSGNITEPSAISASASEGGPIACHGGTTTVTVTASGGTGTLNGTGTFTVHAGPYSYTVTDGNGCTAVVSGNISEPSAISASASAGTILCHDGTTTVTVTASGGTGTLSGTGTFTVNAGPYSFTVTDGNGCEAVVSGTIANPPAISASASAGTILCNNGTTTVIVTASGGTGTLNGTGTFTVHAGPYSYTVTDANGCTAVVSGNITEPSAISASASEGGPIACHGGTTTVTVTASGGTGTLNGTGTFTVHAGPYSYTVTDGNGCTAVVSGNISEPSAISASASAGTILCHDGTTTVTVTASGGTGTLSGTGTFTVNAGPYSFTVTDANGCTAVVSGTIANPPAISASASAGTILCHDGTTTVTVTASGGTGTLSGTGTFTVNAGPYSFTVTDGNGCTAVVSGTIANPPAISASASAGTILCHDGTTTVTVTASGGTGTLNGTGTFTVHAGPYSYTVTDGNGCTAVVSGTIANPPAISASASPGIILCHDGTTTVTVTASGGTGTLSGTGTFTVGAGPYSFTVTDANGCTAVVSGTIANPSAISASASAGTILCHGGSTTVTVSASGGTGTLSGTGTFPVNAGPYSFTVTDANGCTAVVSGNVSEPSALSATATHTDVLCNGGNTGTVTITATGGTPPYTGAGLISGQTAGSHTYIVSDANGCTTSVTETVGEPPVLEIHETHTDLTCFHSNDGTVTITASGGIDTYGGEGTFTGLNAGPHTFTVTDHNNCTASVTVTLTEPAELTATFTSTDVLCHDDANGTVTITAHGGTPGYTGDGFIDNLSAGPHDFVVTDAHGCSTTVHVVIGNPTPLVFTVTENQPQCYGDLGSVTPHISGGVLPYNAITGDDLTGLAAGNYNYTVTDHNGCVSYASANINAAPAVQLTLDAAITQPLCSGQTGSVVLTPDGGTPGYTIFPTTVSNLAAGDYDYTVTDANHCTAVAHVHINAAPSAVVIVPTVSQPRCFGDFGSVTIVGSGGTPGYTGEGTFNNLAAGPYSYTIQDANGCSSAPFNVTINAAPAQLVLTATATQPRCFGQLGSVALSATGGTGSYTFSGSTTNLGPNTYNYSVQDANGCTASATATIDPAPSDIIITSTVTQPLCFGQTGTVVISATGGTGTLHGVGTFPGLAPGPHTFIVTDDNNCSKSVIININTAPAGVTLSVSPVVQPSCTVASGSVTLSASGGNGVYSFTIDGNPVSAGLNTLASGTHAISVQDGNGCSASTTVVINNAPPALFLSAVASQPACFGNTGSATLTPSGGTLPYTIHGPATSGLLAGHYCWFATDGAGCTSATVCVDINAAPSAVTLSANATQPRCNGDLGSVVLTAGGGNGGPYTILPTTTTGLVAGTYTYTASDVKGCTGTTSVTILAAPAALVLNATVTNPACGPGTGSVALSATGGNGGYAYSGANTSNLASGTYTYTVTDSKGCTATKSATVTVPAQLVLTPVATQIACFGGTGSVSLGATGGTPAYTFSGSNTANLAAGTYTYTVTDSHTCKATATAVISPAPTAITVTTSNTPAGCATGGTATANASGGTPPYTYAWNTSPVQTTNPATNLLAGTYTVTVTDSRGCTKTASTTVGTSSGVSLTASATAINCNGGTSNVTLTATGGATPYVFSGGPTTGLAAGTYTFTVTDAGSCQATATVTITQPTLLVVTLTTTQIACFGGTGSITKSATGGTPPYLGTGTVSSLVAGTYTYTITDSKGCSKTASATILPAPAPVVVTAAITPIPCFGGTASVSLSSTGGNGGYVYSGSATTGLVAGTYTYTATDSKGCKGTTSVSITSPTKVSGTTTTLPTGCAANSGSATVTASGGTAPYTYLWNTVPPQTTATATGLGAGIYTVTITDSRGCTGTATANVSSTNAPTCSITPSSTSAICPGGTVTLTGPASMASYSWSTGATTRSITVTPSATTTYNLTISLGGCFAACSYTVNVVSVPTPIITGTLSICAGGSTMLCAQDGYDEHYNWSPNIAVSQAPAPWGDGSILDDQCIMVSPTTTTTYTVTIDGANNCLSLPAYATVVVNPLPSCSISGNDWFCAGGSTTLTASGGGTYLWSTGATTASITVNAGGTYSVTVRSAAGCTSTCSKVVRAPLSVSCSAVNGSCNTGFLGSVSAAVSGGTAPFHYSWSNGATTSSIGGITTAGTYSVVVTDARGCTASCASSVTITTTGGTPDQQCEDFNNQTIAAGNWIWFSAVVKVTYSGPYPCAIHMNNQTITSPAFSVAPGNGTLVLTNAVSQATITYSASGWTVTAPPNCSGEYFISGYAYKVLSTIPKKLGPVCWTGTWSSSCPNVGLEWKWAAAVYTPSFWNNSLTTIQNLNAIGVKPTDGSTCSVYANGDQSGTPENKKAYVVNGARGGGGTNYTGSYSAKTIPSICAPRNCDFNDPSLVVGPRTAADNATLSTTIEEGNMTVTAFPNPFTSSTTIEFERSDKSCHTVVEVYTLTGEKVATLFDSQTEAGVKYTAKFEAENMSEGIYVYRIMSNDHVINGKLILVK